MARLSAALEASAGGGAVRLEERTELNQRPCYDIKVRDYGHGFVEASFIKSSVRRKIKDGSSREDQPKRDFEKEDRARSIRRSAAQVKRKIVAAKLTYLLTLTTREDIKNIYIFFGLFKKFVRLVRKRNIHWAYLAVPEFHKSGAVHIHCAVRGYQDVRFLRSCWLRVVGSGNVDVQGPRAKGPKKWKLLRMVSYLTKYLVKDMWLRKGAQRYRVSEGIELPEEYFIREGYFYLSDLHEEFESRGAFIQYLWTGPGRSFGWATSF